MKDKDYKIIAIQNYGPSGSTLLHSLLDGHTNIISLPWIYGLPLYFIWDNIVSKREINLINLKKSINQHLGVFFDPTLENGDPSLTKMGKNEDIIIKVDKNSFFKHFEEYYKSKKKFQRRDFIISIYLSFNMAYGKNFKENSYISFPIHDQPKKHATYLIEDFYSVKFLHVVRNPIQTIGSLIKHINFNQQKFSLFKSALMCAISAIILEKREHWEEKSYQLYCKTPYFKDDHNIETRYVKLEDIHLKNKDVMNKVCKWLLIPYENCLAESTFMGFEWHNRAESIKSSGINKKTISQKHNKLLSRFDKYRIKLICKNENEYFGYETYNLYDLLIFYLIYPALIILPFKCDFSLRRQIYRFKAMSKKFSNDKYPIFEWILYDSVVNTLPGAELIKIKKDYNSKYMALISFVVSLPIYLIRVSINYVKFRIMIITIWVKIIFKKNHNIDITPIK